MESFISFVPLKASAIVRPSEDTFIFSSISKWSKLEGKECVYEVPTEFDIVRTAENRDGSIDLYCLLETKNLQDLSKWDPLSSTEVDLSVNIDEHEWIPLLESLVDDWNKNGYHADIVVAKKQNHRRATGSRNEYKDKTAILIGLKSKLAIMEIELKCAFAMKSNKHIDFINTKAVSMLPLLAGQNGSNWRHLSECFDTNIIYSELGLAGYDYPDTLFLEGSQKCSLLCAKHYLQNKLNSFVDGGLYATTITSISPLKLSYLRSIFSSKHIMNLMKKYPSYILLTSDGIQFQSYSAALLDIVRKRFVRNILADISELRFWFSSAEGTSEVMISKRTKFKQIAIDHQVIFSYDEANNFISFTGSNESIQRAYKDIIIERLPGVKNIRFTLELDTIYKDFISGKKNGKLMKIMDLTKCAISLENDHSGNMLVVLQGDNIEQLKDSFTLLLQELPCEKSFFIPEAYHRPVIGAGGSVIQTIMRKYNVYIQFSNSFQLPQADWAFIRYDNVIIRCPSKNKANIQAAEEQLLNLSEQYSQIQNTVYVQMSPGQYKYLTHARENLSFISEIEKTYSCYISFPQSLPNGIFHLTIKGNDNGPEQAANALTSHFGREIEINVKDPISNKIISNGLLLPLTLNEVLLTHYDQTIRLTFSSEMTAKKLEKVFFLIETYIKDTNNRINSKKEISPYSSVAPLYGVGKTITDMPQVQSHSHSHTNAPMLNEYSQIRM
ncbi:KH domain-containing protein [Kluyveromyces marxianus]